jgi:hypothetical protein
MNGGGANYQFYVEAPNTTLSGIVYDGGNIGIIDGDTTLLVDTWYHVAYACDRNTDLLHLYLNGVADAVPVDCSGVGNVQPEGTLYVGRQTGAGSLLDGYINEFAVWTYAKNTFGYTRSGVNL